MSNNITKFASQKKQVKSALERIEALEQTINNISVALDSILKKIHQQLGEQQVRTDALVSLTGTEQVEKAIEEARLVAEQEQAAAELESIKKAQEALAVAVTAGRAVKVDAVTEKSLIVGNETKADGTVIPPGRMQLTFNSLRPEFRDQLLGKGVGFQVTPTPAGGAFTVEEIYDIKTDEQMEAESSDNETAQPAPPDASGITPGPATDVPASS